MSGPAPDPPPGLEEGYDLLRHGCGAHRVQRDVLGVEGPDAVAYLQGQCSQDVAALGVGEQAGSLLLAPEGRLVALVRVTRVGEEAFVIDTAGRFGEPVAARLARFRLRAAVEIRSLPWGCVALRGPLAAAALGERWGGGADPAGDPRRAVALEGTWVLPVAWNGTVGVDVLGPDPLAHVPEGVAWCGAPAWEALRVEAGIAEMGRELTTRTIPAETGLLDATVSFTKGCYTGQELVARMEARGNRAPRRLCGVVPDPGAGSGPGAAELVGAEVSVPGGGSAVGTCTSAAWCPGVGGPAALAYLQRSVEVPGALEVLGAGGRRWPARAVPLPMA